MKTCKAIVCVESECTCLLEEPCASFKNNQFCEDVSQYLIVLSDPKRILKYEVSEIGSDFLLEGFKLAAGYYFAEYRWSLEQEYEEGYVSAEYPVIEDITFERMPDWRGNLYQRWFDIKYSWDTFCYYLSRVPKKNWRYCVEFGNLGHSKDVWLWQGIYYLMIRKNIVSEIYYGKPTKIYME